MGLGLQDNDQLPVHLSRFADKIFRVRQARYRDFPADLHSEPVWDIVLSLYRSGGNAAFSRICDDVALPRSTIERWIAVLEQRSFVTRFAPMGNSSVQLALTERGQKSLERVLSAVLSVDQN
jgi:DNA-binding MarR family transcriptional regulator